jgi:transposase
MAHLHKKMKKGRPYYYIREIARVNGKPKVINQVYLGTVERILQLFRSATKCTELKQIQVQEFGALWLANQIDQQIDLVQIVDSVIPKSSRESGPSVGEYFLYAVFNKMVDSCSKRALPGWFKDTAIQQIRPVEIDKLTSERFWQKWERVGTGDIENISKCFFNKIWQLEHPRDDSFLFDTTNYYTFMASDTDSQLSQRGKNKAGRNWLRQVGVALLVSRHNGLPLFYQEYEGNMHDSKLFGEIIDQMLKVLSDLAGAERQLTIVFDKGMNSEANIMSIDDNSSVHFITTYSPCFAEELVEIKLDQFKPVKSKKNSRLKEIGKEQDLLLAWRTTGEYWGKDRAVVVTYNPLTARKQIYKLEAKLKSLEESLIQMVSKVSEQKPQWRDPEKIQTRYEKLCQKLYICPQAYKLTFTYENNQLQMSFQKDDEWYKQQQKSFGKNIIITDNVK